MPKKVPSYKHMFCYRTGLHIKPSQNFVDKFKEIYNDLLLKRKWEDKPKKIDNDTAIFMINSVVEAIVYCLDFGFDVWINRVMVFLQKSVDKRQYTNIMNKYIEKEGLRQITIKPIESITRRIKASVNKDNPKYMEYTANKRENYKKIKDYYKEFYGQEDWWQQED